MKLDNIKCGCCKHWVPSKYNEMFLENDKVGECTGMFHNGVEIEIHTGYDGGYVHSIETNIDFFCANYETS
jgi:hypothetical protein